jgi:hypothetical protein
LRVSCSHQCLAAPWWICSGVVNADQTLMSEKLKEVINLIVRQINAAASGSNQWGIEAKAPTRPYRFGFLDGAFDTAQDQLASRAALAAAA